MANKNRKNIITATDQETFKTVAMRIIRQTVASAINIQPSISLNIGGKSKNENLGNMYGILPFAMSASRDELIEAAEAFEMAKYKYTELGNYYEAWRSGHRQRILEGVLSGMTTFGLNAL